jgi:hypothetical protein
MFGQKAAIASVVGLVIYTRFIFKPNTRAETPADSLFEFSRQASEKGGSGSINNEDSKLVEDSNLDQNPVISDQSKDQKTEFGKIGETTDSDNQVEEYLTFSLDSKLAEKNESDKDKIEEISSELEKMKNQNEDSKNNKESSPIEAIESKFEILEIKLSKLPDMPDELLKDAQRLIGSDLDLPENEFKDFDWLAFTQKYAAKINDSEYKTLPKNTEIRESDIFKFISDSNIVLVDIFINFRNFTTFSTVQLDRISDLIKIVLAQPRGSGNKTMQYSSFAPFLDENDLLLEIINFCIQRFYFEPISEPLQFFKILNEYIELLKLEKKDLFTDINNNVNQSKTHFSELVLNEFLANPNQEFKSALEFFGFTNFTKNDKDNVLYTFYCLIDMTSRHPNIKISSLNDFPMLQLSAKLLNEDKIALSLDQTKNLFDMIKSISNDENLKNLLSKKVEPENELINP